jgi:hypothetical protein
VTGWGSITFENFALVFNASVPYVVNVDDDSSTPAVASTVVAVIVVVLVVAGIIAAGVWFFWCTCCRQRAASRGGNQAPMQHVASNAYPIPTTSHAIVQGAGPAAGSGQDFWACPVCTLLTHNSLRYCSACNTLRS